MPATPIGNVGTYLYGYLAGAGSHREDLTDFIATIDPYDTPLSVLLGRTKARHVVHEWQTDTLAAASTTGLIEGANFFLDTLTAPTRVLNQCMIFGKDIAVTETEKFLNPAGFGDAMAYQIEKGTREIMRNIEKTIMAPTTSASGASGTARQMKTLEDFITSTVKTGASYTGVTGDGTHAGVFNANDINTILNDIWTLGGKTDLMVLNGAYKRQVSALTTSNTRNVLATDKKVVIGVDVYDSDFGLIPIQLNRWSPQSTNTASASTTATDVSGRIWFLQRSMVRLAELRPLGFRPMGTSGDNTAGQLRAELTLEVANQAALGVMKGVNNKSSVS